MQPPGLLLPETQGRAGLLLVQPVAVNEPQELPLGLAAWPDRPLEFLVRLGRGRRVFFPRDPVREATFYRGPEPPSDEHGQARPGDTPPDVVTGLHPQRVIVERGGRYQGPRRLRLKLPLKPRETTLPAPRDRQGLPGMLLSEVSLLAVEGAEPGHQLEPVVGAVGVGVAAAAGVGVGVGVGVGGGVGALPAVMVAVN